jgi:hypothetical protein
LMTPNLLPLSSPNSHCLDNLGFIAPKDCFFLLFRFPKCLLSVRTWWRLFQKCFVRNKINDRENRRCNTNRKIKKLRQCWAHKTKKKKCFYYFAFQSVDWVFVHDDVYSRNVSCAQICGAATKNTSYLSTVFFTTKRFVRTESCG